MRLGGLLYTVHRKVPQSGSVMRILLADDETNVRYGLRDLCVDG